MGQTTAISVRIDENIKAALERAAAADRRSLSSLVAKIFDEYLAGQVCVDSGHYRDWRVD